MSQYLPKNFMRYKDNKQISKTIIRKKMCVYMYIYTHTQIYVYKIV